MMMNNNNNENLSTAVHSDELQTLRKRIQLQTNKSQSNDQKINQVKQKIQAAKLRIQQKNQKLTEVQQLVAEQRQKADQQPLLHSHQSQSNQQPSINHLSINNNQIISQLREHFKALRMQMMSVNQWDEEDSDDDYEDQPDVDNMTYQELLELGERIGKVSKGLDNKKLQSLKVKKYHKHTKGEESQCKKLEGSPTKSSKQEEQTVECAICRQEFQQNSQYIELHCKHIFHQDCIKGWLNVQKNCPNCKRQIVVDLQQKKTASPKKN